MTAPEALRRKASRMPHAIAPSITIFPDGKTGEETELHYLTCEACKLLKLADEIEREVTRNA